MIYLDHNATTPVRPEVVDAMLPWLRQDFGNPNSVYALGQKARAAVERAREQVATLIGASDASEIVFTSGGSESDVLAIAGASWQAFDETKGRRRKIVTTKIEHDAIGELLAQMRRRGFDVRQAGCNREGFTNAQEMSQLIDESTSVVSIMHANNETGVLQPVHEIVSAAKSHGVPIHTDAVQSLGKVPLNVQNLGIDLLALSGHKLNAPKGVGALYVRRGTRLSAVITGHQEKNRRGGTENVAGIVALGLAAELARQELPAAQSHALALRRRIEAKVLSLEGAQLNGHADHRLPNTSHFSFAGVDGHHLVVALDLNGVCVSSGPACSSGASTPSHVLTAMGIDPRLAVSSIRVSVGFGTTDADVDQFLDVLPRAVERLRTAAAHV